MSAIPVIGGQPGTYEERLGQWFLEGSFFRDFVYRNPRGKKKGEELADAIVLFDDVVLMVQIKAQCGSHDPISWATEKLRDALRQVQRTHRDLVGGYIKKLRNDLYDEVGFNPTAYPHRIGIIILAHESPPYVAADLVPETLTAGFPIHVFSLSDFALVASRCDTAGDLVPFLEMRADVSAKEVFYVQAEAANIKSMIPHIESVLRSHMPPTSDEMLQKTARAMEKVATGELQASPDWKYGLAIDDMIARAHDADPALPWNSNGRRAGMEVAKFLGWLTRSRRIELGKRLITACDAAARDGKNHWFRHVQPSRGAACVYLVSSQNRADRLDFLELLVAYAHMKSGVRQCLGIATEPIGGGRSYEFCITRKQLPHAAIAQLQAIGDPFSSEAPLWTD